MNKLLAQQMRRYQIILTKTRIDLKTRSCPVGNLQALSSTVAQKILKSSAKRRQPQAKKIPAQQLNACIDDTTMFCKQNKILLAKKLRRCPDKISISLGKNR